jgi:hypothetical protein
VAESGGGNNSHLRLAYLRSRRFEFEEVAMDVLRKIYDSRMNDVLINF